MSAIAILAILFGASLEAQRLLRRRQHFLEQAEAHTLEKLRLQAWAKAGCASTTSITTAISSKRIFRGISIDYSDHWAVLERRYRYAASHPWLELEPDPPGPSYP